MEILGLVFAGSATPHRAAMARLATDVLGLTRVDDPSTDADLFDLPDGSRFAVADEREPGGGTSRTVGFLVADLDEAVADAARRRGGRRRPGSDCAAALRALRRPGRRALRACPGALTDGGDRDRFG